LSPVQSPNIVLELCSSSKAYINFIFAVKKPIYSTKVKEEVVGLNWKVIVASHWKFALLIIQLSLLAIHMISGVASAEPIDCPGGG
jgi:hypothetical protein